MDCGLQWLGERKYSGAFREITANEGSEIQHSTLWKVPAGRDSEQCQPKVPVSEQMGGSSGKDSCVGHHQLQ